MSVAGLEGIPDKWGDPELGTPSGTVSWYVDLTGLPIEGGTSLSSFEAELDDAFEIWTDVANVSFSQTDSTAADITIVAARLEDISPDFPNIEDAAGLATRTFIPGSEIDQITSVDIYFDTDLTWNLDGNFFKVAAHEIGHALGIEHIIDDTEIMNPTVKVSALGDQDTLAVQTLYGTGGAIDGDPDPSVDDTDDDPVTTSSGGGGGGGAGLVLGLLAAVFAFMFGGGGGAAAVAALGRVDDEPDDIPDPDFDDLPPMVEVDTHAVFLNGIGGPHGFGCGCSCCAMEPEAADDLFV